MKRRAFTLIELMVTLPLLMILTTFLLKSYAFSSKSLKVMNVDHQKALKEHYFQRRLQKILDRAVICQQKKEHFQKGSLDFKFDNGMSEDERLRGRVCAKLFYDETARCIKLCLLKHNQILREEILLEKVNSCELSYFFEEKKQNIETINPFEISKDPALSKANKWVALEIITEPQKRYFFTLNRSKAPS